MKINRKHRTKCVSVKGSYYRELKATMADLGIKLSMQSMISSLIDQKLDEMELEKSNEE